MNWEDPPSHDSPSRHRTEVLLPIKGPSQRLLAESYVRPASAPSSPSRPFATIPGTQSSSVTFSVNSSRSPKLYSKYRHYSLSNLPLSNYFEPRASGSTLRVSVSPGTTIRLFTSDVNRSRPSSLVRVTETFDMNFNRQMSTPIGSSSRFMNERKTSLEVPPRPSSASPGSSRTHSVPLPMTEITDEDNYISALLKTQDKGLIEICQASLKMDSLLDEKRAVVNRLERNLNSQCSLGPNANFNAYKKAEELIELRAKIRKLRVECHCLVFQIDSHGDHHLGDVELKMRRKPVEQKAPPIPPRPSPNYQVQRPSFGPLDVRVPPPSFPYRIPPTAHCPLIIEERPSEEQWACVACSFINHPELRTCEMCMTSKQSYSILTGASGGNQVMFYAVPVFFPLPNGSAISTSQPFWACNNPFLGSMPINANASNDLNSLSTNTNSSNNSTNNNISCDYSDNNGNCDGNVNKRSVTVVSCLSPSSCSSHTRCYCHSSSSDQSNNN